MFDYKDFFARYSTFLIGLSVMALGATITIKMQMGTPPISSAPYVASLVAMSVGFFAMILNVIFVLAQFFILGKDFQKNQWFQIIAAFLIGALIDMWMFILPDYTDTGYSTKIIYLIVGNIIMGFGIFLQIKSRAMIVPGEGVVLALTRKTNYNFGTIKIFFDLFQVLFAVVLSLILLGEIHGVREGTLLSACFVGFVVRFFLSIYEKLKTKYFTSEEII